MNRSTKTLGEVCDFLDNLRKPVTESERNPGPYPYYGANGQVGTIDTYIFDEPLILLAEDGGNWGDTTKPIAYPIYGKSWVNNHAHVLKPKTDYDFKFVLYSVAYKDVSKLISGSTRGKLTKKAAESIEIHSPPLSEQRRIASVLSRADELRQKRRQADELSGRFLQSLFVKTFGDPETNPKKWERVTIGDIAEVGTGGTPSTKVPAYYEKGTIRWMKSGNVTGIYVYDVPNKISKVGMESSNAVLHPVGSVMLAMSGQGKTRGQTTILKNPMACSQSVAALTPKKGAVTPEYLLFNLKLRYSELRDITGMNDRAGLNLKIIRNIPILKPPFRLQEKFASKVTKFEEFRKRQEEAGLKVELLFKSLMDRYFGG